MQFDFRSDVSASVSVGSMIQFSLVGLFAGRSRTVSATARRINSDSVATAAAATSPGTFDHCAPCSQLLPGQSWWKKRQTFSLETTTKVIVIKSTKLRSTEARRKKKRNARFCCATVVKMASPGIHVYNWIVLQRQQRQRQRLHRTRTIRTQRRRRKKKKELAKLLPKLLAFTHTHMLIETLLSQSALKAKGRQEGEKDKKGGKSSQDKEREREWVQKCRHFTIYDRRCCRSLIMIQSEPSLTRGKLIKFLSSACASLGRRGKKMEKLGKQAAGSSSSKAGQRNCRFLSCFLLLLLLGLHPRFCDQANRKKEKEKEKKRRKKVLRHKILLCSSLVERSHSFASLLYWFPLLLLKSE